ncbi:MAG: MaoC family dehydratase N-terminal domain-containing protein [Anaerolineae bacterium]|nr:MaoC family dehydratase N-terminal domain-containing protein [Anaerolineae bacterium]MCB9106464.1 MaoC family dehydratase N-terminal domain-containing protein [Anaerolineales bacterium]
MPALNLPHLKQWIGTTEETTDVITLPPVARMAATLDKPPTYQDGDELPPAWHWLYFLPTTPMSETGPDGHAKRGGFIPPVPLPRRMWAAGKFDFVEPLRIGQPAHKKSEVVDVALKEGKSGQLVFVPVRHTISGPNGVALIEEQTLVYREAPQPGSPPPKLKPAPTNADWSRQIEPNIVLLFRYSALTFNAHLIHYDRDHCAHEGYPGLVVHGPLIATLLLDLVCEHLPNETIKQFSFRAVSPLFDIHPFTINGRREGQTVILWAANHEGVLATEATATLA